MHILTVCPRCRTTYQVLQSLRGQMIRCPKPQCRHVFAVGGESAPPPAGDGADPQPQPPTPERPQQSGNVGEMVPILPTEPAAPPAAQVEELPEINNEADEPQAAPPLWQSAPPAVRKPPRPGAPLPAGSAASPPPSRPASGPSWREAPPPVRKPGAAAPQDKATEVRRRTAADTVRLNRPTRTERTPPQETPPQEPPTHDGSNIPPSDVQPSSADLPPPGPSISESELAPRVGRKRAWWVIIGLCLVVFLTLGIVSLFVVRTVQQGEDELRAHALEDYRGGRYHRAAKEFEELSHNFPNSEHIDEYKFLTDWSDLAGRLHDTDTDAGPATDHLVALLTKFKDNQALPTFGRDLGQALAGLADSLDKRNSPEAASDEPLAMAVRLDEAKTLLRKTAGRKALDDGAEGRIDTALSNVRAAVDRWQRRTAILTRLKRLPGNADGLRLARNILKDRETVKLNLPDSSEVKSILASMEERHLDSVRKNYLPSTTGEPSPVGREAGPPSIVVDPLLAGSPGGAPPDDPVRLALARGVLYALRQGNGSVKWVRRVGIDTTALPEYVGRTIAHSDRFLVISSDSKTLTALDAEGNEVWEYRLDSPALGRPLKVNNRVYLPTYDGTVHEIEVGRGVLLGRYHLGQHLTTGGAREGDDSSLLYFAADDSCVYVLDVAQRTCIRILYTGHPAGSLRSAPIIIPPVKLAAGEATPGYLVLNQADGLDGVQLRVYELPLNDAHQDPLRLDPEPRLEGWTWFRPRYDAETLAILSDRARLGLFGIRQANNKDQALFPLLSPGGLDLTPFLGLADNALRTGRRGGRSQVVYSQGNDFWVLAQGRLQRIGLAWSPQYGPQAAPGWDSPLALGSPLHDSQVAEDPRHAQSTLFVVTQPLNRQLCMATAVDAANGRVLWQRQLGLVCRGQPLELTPPGGGAPMLLALDQSGSLFALDPTRFPGTADPWQTGGQNIAGALQDNPRMPPVLLAAPDGHTAYEVACPGDGTNLLVRQIECQAAGRRLFVKAERTLAPDNNRNRSPSAAPAIAGHPAIVGSWLMLATGRGSLVRLALPLAAPDKALPDVGPDWRGKDVTAPDAKCYVAALSPEIFLASDGGKRLRCWQWGAEASSYTPLPQDQQDPALELTDPIVAPPVVLPAGGLLARVCVADASNTLSLITVRNNGEQRVSRTWDLGGTLTRGPFVRTLPNGQIRIGCVIQDRRLVWIDPNRDGKSWEYAASRSIVGSPEVIDNVVVVADQGGHVVGLDPLTGRARGPGSVLQGSAIPVASPVSFGPGRIFVPACDGTAVLLKMGQLLEPLRTLPIIW